MLEVQIDVSLASDADAAELDEAARALRSELLELDVHDVRRPSGGPSLPGARAVDVAIVGSLVVTAAREMVAAVVRTAERWVGRRPARTIKLTIGDDTIELSDASDEDHRRLVELFLTRNATARS
ncbi:MAG: hypothetical protein ACRDLN_14220 [Solirubrobacteraceae bacterium]